MAITSSLQSFVRKRVLQRPLTNVFIDGLNLYYGALKSSPGLRWLNLEDFVSKLLPDERVGTIHYFTARVLEIRPDDRARERQEVYLRALRTLTKVEIHEGYFLLKDVKRVLSDKRFNHHDLFTPKFLPSADFDRLWADKVSRRSRPYSRAMVEMPEEKATDVSLGAHLVRDCLLKRCDKAVLISNDGDFRDAIRIAVASGTDVQISNPQRRNANHELDKASTGSIPFPRDLLLGCQFPPTLVDAKGRQIHQPKEWR